MCGGSHRNFIPIKLVQRAPLMPFQPGSDVIRDRDHGSGVRSERGHGPEGSCVSFNRPGPAPPVTTNTQGPRQVT